MPNTTARRSYRKLARSSKCRDKPPITCRKTVGCKFAHGKKRKFCRKTKNTMLSRVHPTQDSSTARQRRALIEELSQDGFVLEDASAKFKNDKDVVLAAAVAAEKTAEAAAAEAEAAAEAAAHRNGDDGAVVPRKLRKSMKVKKSKKSMKAKKSKRK